MPFGGCDDDEGQGIAGHFEFRAEGLHGGRIVAIGIGIDELGGGKFYSARLDEGLQGLAVAAIFPATLPLIAFNKGTLSDTFRQFPSVAVRTPQ